MRKKILCSVILSALLVTAGCTQKNVATEGKESFATGGETAGVDNGVVNDAVAVDGEYSLEKAADMAVGGEAPKEGSVAATPEAPVTSEPDDTPEAMQLTAGEWNDNENWGFFMNLVNTDKIQFPSYGIDPRERNAVTVKNADGKPVVNAEAVLKDADDNALWSAVTNKEGIAYLFVENSAKPASIEVTSNGKSALVKVDGTSSSNQVEKKASSGEFEVVLEDEGTLYKKTDIMFVLDATGSMADEMSFLQSEFTAITKALGTDNTRYSVNFYRDEGDEYVTKCYDFTSDISDLQKKLNSEAADGGGDLPEAVAEVLEKTVYESNWDDDAVKLMFLIFDAPPHEEASSNIQRQIKSAAEKGIRIIPIVSSNSDRDTELFGRAAAIATGGDYIFLTDDSGIGDSHLEPIIGDYEVKKLYDRIIEVVNNYKQ